VRRDWEEAVRAASLDRLQRIWEDGGDIDARDGHGQTALMLAAVAGHDEVVEWLIAHHAALDHTAKYGLSALMLAVVYGHVAVVRALVAAGAETRLTGTGPPGFAGKTALQLAMDKGHAEMVEILSAAAQGGRG
jgi:ankyrin repeat protein